MLCGNDVWIKCDLSACRNKNSGAGSLPEDSLRKCIATALCILYLWIKSYMYGVVCACAVCNLLFVSAVSTFGNKSWLLFFRDCVTIV